MRASSNTNVASNKLYVFKDGKICIQETSSSQQSLNNINSTPLSNRNASQAQDANLSPPEREQESINTSLDRALEEKNTNKRKAEFLPKINNPKAENRLKALIKLLEKKNPTVPKSRVSLDALETLRDNQEILSAERRGDKSPVVLPALTFLAPKALDKKDLDEVQKKLNKFGGGKVIIKVKPEAPEVQQNVKGSSDPIKSAIRRTQGRELSVPAQNKKKIVFKQYSPSTGKEKSKELSPKSDDDASKGNDSDISKNSNNIRVRKFVELPQPDVTFDSRVHKVSVDDALERLIQLTNQSENARKDLLKIQENALVFKLRYERKHKPLSKISTEGDLARNQ